MKIYTRTGDDGETGLVGGARVPKTHPRVEAYGGVDELNSLLGVALAHLEPRSEGDAPDLAADLTELQAELFVMGADLATPPDAAARVERIGEGHAARLEARIDHYQESLAPLTHFVLPGGCPAGAFLHLARTVCRRAERAVLRSQAGTGEQALAACVVYLNRLSDLLFVMARFANARAPGGPAEVLWKGASA